MVLADIFGLRAPFIVSGVGMIVLAVVMAPIVNTRTIRAAEDAAVALEQTLVP